MRLNAGAGPVRHDGWVALDLNAYPGGVIAEMTALPFRSGAFESAASNHALQMLPWPELVPALAELRRVVAVGGWLRLVLPDLLGAVAAYLEGRPEHFVVVDAIEPEIDGKLCVYISQAGSSRSVFTERYVRELLHRAGWAKAYSVAAGVTFSGDAALTALDSRPDESIFVDAT